MDASELFPIVGAVLAGVVAGTVCWQMRRLPSRGLRISVMAVTGLLSVVALVMAGALTFFDENYVRHLAPLVSPDGRHVAETSYTVNTGQAADQVEVAIRSAWSPYGHRVYAGLSQYEPNAATPEPEVRWVDSGHLEIRFHMYGSGGEQGCAAAADGVSIACLETRVHAVK